MNTFKKTFRFLSHFFLYATLGLFFLIGFIRVSMLMQGRSKTFQPDFVPPAPVALVLGAGLNKDGTPGIVLQDRVKTGVDLYFTGKVSKLLLSGDNSSIYYNEPGAMGAYALSLGVPEEDIVFDYAGRRTYDSCYRAKEIFNVDQMIIVTQAFHLPRALFICNAFEIKSLGVAADDANYNRQNYTFWWVREILASVVAAWDVFIAKPSPILGNPEPIFP